MAEVFIFAEAEDITVEPTDWPEGNNVVTDATITIRKRDDGTVIRERVSTGVEVTVTEGDGESFSVDTDALLSYHEAFTEANGYEEDGIYEYEFVVTLDNDGQEYIQKYQGTFWLRPSAAD